MRGVGAILACGLMVASLAAAAVAQGHRRHRLHTPPAELPRALVVDEFEYRLRPSKRTVAAGRVRIRAYNRGQDDHDLVLVDHRGVTHRVDLKPGATGVIAPLLRPGRYTLLCSLFAGTPESHERLGMSETLLVR